MTILALDLGTKLGWAISYGPGDILHGTIEFKNGRFEGGGMRWLRFRQWLDGMLENHCPIEAIYFEEVRRHAGTDAAHAYGGFLAHLTAWCEKCQLPYAGIPVGTIKKHATGKGNANKEAMMAAMSVKGFTPETDNDADALALLLCVLDGPLEHIARLADDQANRELVAKTRASANRHPVPCFNALNQ